MTFIGISKDLAMLWLWLGSLFTGGAIPSAMIHASAPKTALAQAVDEFVIRRYTYLFEGLAATQEGACPHASVMVRLTSPHDAQLHFATADQDGRYALEFTIEAASREPVDWTMEAYTSDGKQVEIKGRRIVMKDDNIITVHDGRDSAAVATRKPPIRYSPSSSLESSILG